VQQLAGGSRLQALHLQGSLLLQQLAGNRCAVAGQRKKNNSIDHKCSSLQDTGAGLQHSTCSIAQVSKGKAQQVTVSQ
jgi:hypothetical protein